MVDGVPVSASLKRFDPGDHDWTGFFFFCCRGPPDASCQNFKPYIYCGSEEDFLKK
jgi:hypothetical protein